ncbi:MAG: hypothetical protein LUF02_09515 [Erysipelotrichaceae bacterium]|nr:hypothetical protein [Erysipelotrichaceae bacterium]
MAYEYDVPIRQGNKIIDNYEYAKCMDFIKEICEHNEGIIKSMCLIDQKLCDISSYNLPRMKELALFTSQELKDYIKSQNIKIISFSDL